MTAEETAGRWVRLDTTWSQSEWLAVLSPGARLAWVELLVYTKAHGFDGRVKALAPLVFGRAKGIDAADVTALLEAAAAHGAMETVGGTWVITNWSEQYGAPRLSKERWDAIRHEVFKRDDYTCQYCGAREKPLECDHIHPIARGGTNRIENLTTACMDCNRSKNDKTLDEWVAPNV